MQNIQVFFPAFAAVLFGLAYALYSRGFQALPLGTAILIHGTVWFLATLAHAIIVQDSLDVTRAFRGDGLYMLCGSLAMVAGAMLSYYCIKAVSPTFAAVGELGYVLMTPIFMFLLFGKKDFDIYTLIGGAVVFIGIGIVIYGRYSKPAVIAVAGT